MCGIFCVLNNFSNNCDNLISQLKFEGNIKRRGPDSFNFCVATSEDVSLAFATSILWLQGSNITSQPIEDDVSIFCYNGDIFSGFDSNHTELGDTKPMHSFIKELIANHTVSELCKVHGPFAFIYFDKLKKKLYFARDIYGRRSLLIGRNEEMDTIIITSVAKVHSDFKFMEIPSIGIFSLNIHDKKFDVDFWRYKNKNFYSKLKDLESFLGNEISVVMPLSEGHISIRNFEENVNLSLLKSMKNDDDILLTLIANQHWCQNVNKLHELLDNAVKTRIATQPPFCQNCVQSKTKCNHATTGILFSGGVDCAVLAALCDTYVDKNRPIDLLNVSFDESHNFNSPDRITGLQTLEELKCAYPNRHWNFVEINVTDEELNEQRDKHISDLIYPLNTILDDSLGCALWFAARGQSQQYISPTRIVIVGMGADELFGGYSRHRTAFKRYSWKGLQETLDEDWMNLPYRNLGRDDRVVSDNGRQLRTPYLDETVVKFVTELEPWEKTYPSDSFPQGIGDKVLLRTLAYKLGLKQAAVLKKRALQFGSRIANPKENAHEVSPRLNF